MLRIELVRISLQEKEKENEERLIKKEHFKLDIHSFIPDDFLELSFVLVCALNRSDAVQRNTDLKEGICQRHSVTEFN